MDLEVQVDTTSYYLSPPDPIFIKMKVMWDVVQKLYDHLLWVFLLIMAGIHLKHLLSVIIPHFWTCDTVARSHKITPVIVVVVVS